MSSYTVGPIYGPVGSLQRARLYAPDATETDVALTEGAPQTFSGTVSLATTPDATWNYEVRQVATQDTAGFDGSTTEIISYGSLGYLFASQIRTFPLSINLGLTGKAATLYYHVVNDADGTDLVARSNANVIETAAAGQYYVTGGASWDAAINATVLWDETVTGATASESWPAQAAMTLTSAYDAAKTAASQTSVDTANTGITSLLSRIPAGGAGVYQIDHSGGVGAGDAAATLDVGNTGTFASWPTDGMRYTDSAGEGIASVQIRAYQKANYDASTGTGFSGESVSGTTGRWISPLNLNSGDYYIIASLPGVVEANMSAIRIP